mmetsp:Transcript_4481/g.5195  ORF Transcript_4481/g.5195 Transcript_4481/m.5195 type:complete len:232 (+) Transcript_4481:92-787(+)
MEGSTEVRVSSGRRLSTGLISIFLLVSSKPQQARQLSINFCLQNLIQTLGSLVQRIRGRDETVIKSLTTAASLCVIGIQSLLFGQGSTLRVRLISGAYILECLRVILAARNKSYWQNRPLSSMIPAHQFERSLATAGPVEAAVYFSTCASIPAILQCTDNTSEEVQSNYWEQIGWSLYAVSLLWGTYDGATDLVRLSFLLTTAPSLIGLWESKKETFEFKSAMSLGLILGF